MPLLCYANSTAREPYSESHLLPRAIIIGEFDDDRMPRLLRPLRPALPEKRTAGPSLAFGSDSRLAPAAPGGRRRAWHWQLTWTRGLPPPRPRRRRAPGGRYRD